MNELQTLNLSSADFDRFVEYNITLDGDKHISIKAGYIFNSIYVQRMTKAIVSMLNEADIEMYLDLVRNPDIWDESDIEFMNDIDERLQDEAVRSVLNDSKLIKTIITEGFEHFETAPEALKRAVLEAVVKKLGMMGFPII